MKITDVKPLPVWGGSRNFFFVKVETDEGIYGIGEGGITWRELAATECVNHLKSVLIGEDPRRIEHLWQVMFRGGFFPAGRIACSAISAIDIALWDIRGKVLGVPVYDLLGGLVRQKAVCYPHANGNSPNDLQNTHNHLWRTGGNLCVGAYPSRGRSSIHRGRFGKPSSSVRRFEMLSGRRLRF